MKVLSLIIVFAALYLSCSDRKIADPGGGNSTNNQPTEISGTLNGQLRLSDSPFFVTDDIFVDSLQSLSITAGVELIFSDSARLVVRGALFASGNKERKITFHAAATGWGGIHFINTTGKSVLEFCEISDVQLVTLNSTENGAIEINHSQVDLLNNIIRDNYSDFGGAISAIDSSDIVLKNNVLRNNQCVVFGGGMLVFESTAVIHNNTFYKNRTDNVGGGLVLLNAEGVDVQNNIFYQNSGTQGDPRIHSTGEASGNVLIAFNFDDPLANPLFVSENDMHLQSNSPAMDAGNPDASFNDPDGSRNDMGAYGGPGGDW